MAEARISAARREGTGKGAARQTRVAGRVPAILYGKDMEPVAISVDRRDLVLAFHTDSGMNVLLDIDIEGKSTLALTKELQRDPVRGTLLHADFQKVDRSQEVEVEVPVHVVGESPGVKEGGILEHPLFSVHVRCRVDAVPESVAADISMMNIGDTLRVSDLGAVGDYTILNDPDLPVINIAPPIVVEVEVEEEVAEEAVEGAPPAGAEESAPDEG